MAVGRDLTPNRPHMSTPTLRAIGRMTLVSFGVALLFIALDVVFFAGGSGAIQWWLAGRATSKDLDAQARSIAEAAAAHPSAARPELLRSAWRLGFGFGASSQAAHSAAVRGDTALAIKADAMLRNHDADARALGLEPIGPLRGRSIADAAALTQRVEDDEAGIAARMAAATTPLHREWFLLGAHVGLEWVQRVTPNAPEGNFGGPFIARHARLAGIEPALWQPLSDPPGADAAHRRAAFIAAMQALDANLSPPAAR